MTKHERHQTNCKATTETLIEENKLFQSIIESLGDGVVVFNELYNITYYNCGMMKLCQFDKNLVEGKKELSLQDIMEEKFSAEINQIFEQVISGKTVFREGVNPFSKSKASNCYTSETYYPLYSTDKKITGIVGVLKDISKQFLDEQKIHEQQKHQEQLEELVLNRTSNMAKSNSQLKLEVEKRKEVEKVLRAEKELATKYLDIAGVMVAVVDKNKKVTLVNKKGRQLLGLSEEEIIGKDWFDNFIPSRIRNDLLKYFQDIMESNSGNIKPHENPIISSSGQEQIMFWHNTILRDELGAPTAVLASGEDITEIKETQRRQRILLNETRDANLAKSHFLSRMSHELRTPLTAILGFGQIITGEDLDPQMTKEYCGYILDSGKHLLELINEILDLSKVESGEIELLIETINVNDVIMECLDMMSSSAQKNNIALMNDLHNQKMCVKADYVRLKQIFVNLLTNGIKYNHENGVVSISAKELDDHKLRIQIRDNGFGIPEDQLEKIFDPFVRIKKVGRNIDGTGIGLTITKQLVLIMGADIGVESKEGEGSTFWIDFPLSFESASKKYKEEVTENNQIRAIFEKQFKRKFRIIYVEDNPINVQLMTAVLTRNRDIEMVYAMSAEDGLQMINTQTFDLIILDINLPGMDGYQALSKIKSNPKTNLIPVIALSALATNADIKRGVEAGFLHYLTKPFNPRKLLNIISDIILEICNINLE
ncbi:MAG: response regulator [Bacteriovoracaceae bacterium]|nr:response regulator [Bacteriovoracaceae bacterium]